MDGERKSLALGLASGLALLLRGTTPGFVYGTETLEIVLLVISDIAFALGAVLALIVLLPRLRERVPSARFPDSALIFEVAVVSFAVGIIATVVAYSEVAIRSIGDSPFE